MVLIRAKKHKVLKSTIYEERWGIGHDRMEREKAEGVVV